MHDYRVLSYRAEAGPRGGVSLDGYVYDLERVLGGQHGIASTMALLDDWSAQSARLEAALGRMADGASVPPVAALADVELLPPLLYPSALFCITANYRDHAIEMGGVPADKSTTQPYFFLKSPAHTISGPRDPIRLPVGSSFVDWEAELAVVVGRRATRVPAAEAKDYIAGYTILHDVSARDRFRRDDWPRWPMDWFGHKNFDGSAPMGPWITPAAAVRDPHALAIRLWVNDTLMQDSSTAQMIFDIYEQIEYLSSQITLRPGDVIATGTPAGCGRPKGISLHAGDRVRIEIEGLGMLDNLVEQATLDRDVA